VQTTKGEKREKGLEKAESVKKVNGQTMNVHIVLVQKVYAAMK